MNNTEKIREELFGKGRWTFGGDGSHWDGCYETHWDCALVHLTARIAELEGALKKIETAFFEDGSDETAANRMLNIAQEVLK